MASLSAASERSSAQKVICVSERARNERHETKQDLHSINRVWTLADTASGMRAHMRSVRRSRFVLVTKQVPASGTGWMESPWQYQTSVVCKRDPSASVIGLGCAWDPWLTAADRRSCEWCFFRQPKAYSSTFYRTHVSACVYQSATLPSRYIPLMIWRIHVFVSKLIQQQHKQ